jgi:two-component system LytT family response regulator
VVVHVGPENHILRDTLTNLESKLPAAFQRISRSIIVNLDKIKELQPATRGEYFVVLKNNQKLNMSRGLREVQERLQYS